MLWRVADTNLYILGSVHVSDEPLVFSEQTVIALEKAEILAFESNIDAVTDPLIGRFKSGSRLNNTIPKDLFDDTSYLWARFLFDPNELNGLQAWRVGFRLMSEIMQQHGFLFNEGIDRRVLELGKSQQRKLFFLESINAVSLIMSKVPSAEQELFLALTVRKTEEEVQLLRQIVTAWKNQKPDDLIPVLNREFRLLPAMYSALLHDRNKAWLPQLLRLARGRRNTVAIVGALHMVGPNNLSDLLSNQGLPCARLT